MRIHPQRLDPGPRRPIVARKKHTPEQIIQNLRGAEIALAQGQPVGAVAGLEPLRIPPHALPWPTCRSADPAPTPPPRSPRATRPRRASQPAAARPDALIAALGSPPLTVAGAAARPPARRCSSPSLRRFARRLP